MPYEFLNNTYSKTAKDDLKDRINVEIGDSKQPDKFYSQLKIMRWDNESNVSIRLIDNEPDIANVIEEGGKIKYIKEKFEAHFYNLPISKDLPEGGQEFEIILKEKPKSNVIQFSLVDKDVEYFYQPELTKEEIEEGCRRPENVVGSYAVYAKLNKVNYEGGKLYRCGKVGHIYRPKIIDSVGTKVWGDLHIENGILSVTIPQEFLDKAVYPVRHAAGLTFGYETKGGSTSNMKDNITGSQFTGASGTGTSITAWLFAFSAVKTKFAIYLHSDSSFVMGTAEDNGGHGVKALKVTLNFTSQPTLSATDYVLVGWSQTNEIDIYYDAGSTNQRHTQSLSYGAWPNPATFIHSNPNTNKYSIYCTYTAGGATKKVKNIIQPGLIPVAR